MHCLFLISAGVLGAAGVGFGASAAHGLEQHMTADAIALVDTASRYLLWHALALFGCAITIRNTNTRNFRLPGLLFLAGTILFSGSLLCVAFFSLKPIAIGAPIGGFTLILGWLSLILVGVKKEKADKPK